MATVKPEPTDDPGSGVSHVDQAPQAPAAVSYLQQVASSTSTEELEKGVGIGVRLLEGLKEPLEAVAPLNTTQASHWLKSIGDLESLAKPTRTIVGVVGNTGAGKSSVISAVLDEER
jgi:ABC-type transport system involved in cytochrome bd biosynthesis fused ATPase/permease subunit